MGKEHAVMDADMQKQALKLDQHETFKQWRVNEKDAMDADMQKEHAVMDADMQKQALKLDQHQKFKDWRVNENDSFDNESPVDDDLQVGEVRNNGFLQPRDVGA